MPVDRANESYSSVRRGVAASVANFIIKARFFAANFGTCAYYPDSTTTPTITERKYKFR